MLETSQHLKEDTWNLGLPKITKVLPAALRNA